MSGHYLSWKRGVLGACLVLACCCVLVVAFPGCMTFQQADVPERFSNLGRGTPIFYNHKDTRGSIFVVSSGSGPGVVFVHGSPGSWDNFSNMFSDTSLNSRFTLVAVDRPGFGESLPKGPEPSLSVQAQRIHDAVAASGVSFPAIWVGHSLGGPVVARLAVDYPEAVSGLLLVAPSMDPELEEWKWFNRLAKFPLVKWGLPRAWRNSNEEIFPLKGELQKLQPALATLRSPTIVLQGDRDKLVPPANADYVKREMPEGVVELRILKGVNHFIPWSNPDEMKVAIIDLSELAKR